MTLRRIKFLAGPRDGSLPSLSVTVRTQDVCSDNCLIPVVSYPVGLEVEGTFDDPGKRTCPYCSSLTDAGSDNCKNCGAPEPVLGG